MPCAMPTPLSPNPTNKKPTFKLMKIETLYEANLIRDELREKKSMLTPPG